MGSGPAYLQSFGHLFLPSPKALAPSIHCLANVQITSGTGQVTAPALHDLCFPQLQEK